MLGKTEGQMGRLYGAEHPVERALYGHGDPAKGLHNRLPDEEEKEERGRAAAVQG